MSDRCIICGTELTTGGCPRAWEHPSKGATVTVPSAPASPDLSREGLIAWCKDEAANYRNLATPHPFRPDGRPYYDTIAERFQAIASLLSSSPVWVAPPVSPEIDLWRLAWLLQDVADRLPMTDVGRERYVELRGFAEQIERVRARLASPERSGE